MMRSIWMLCVMGLGCASEPPPFPTSRFVNAPPVPIVDDRHNVPKPPHERLGFQDLYAFETLVTRPVLRTLDVPRERRAQGVNSIDEVPDSTWFTNRGELTVDQFRTGAVTLDSPELHFPWTVKSNKFGGATLGFIVTDARGVKYLLKLDDKNFPEIQTGADVVTDRLMWAAGYNVPEDQIVYFREEDLVLAPNASITGRYGERQAKLTKKKFEETLSHSERGKDGRYRATASRWIDGKPAGDPGGEGVRGDDPNDRIRHELRRDRRGLYSIFAWVDMVDVWPGNFLDMWTQDPGDPQRHYLVHYSLDFDSSLSAMGSTGYDVRRSYTFRFDWPTLWGSLLSAGLITWDWEGRDRNLKIRGVPALFTAVGFDPGNWHCDLPYLPFETKDRFDAFWGAKIIARFSREQIHAAVEAGRYSDPRAVEYITNTLVARQRKTARYWYQQVSPLDNFSTTADQVCFDDLAIAQDFVEDRTATRYVITSHDVVGHMLAAAEIVKASPDGHTCSPVPAVGTGPDSYTILEVITVRAGFKGTTYIHVARDHDGALRVIGIWRV
jgi:hypothetical protein